jgi:hypothetical protein
MGILAPQLLTEQQEQPFSSASTCESGVAVPPSDPLSCREQPAVDRVLPALPVQPEIGNAAEADRPLRVPVAPARRRDIKRLLL